MKIYNVLKVFLNKYKMKTGQKLTLFHLKLDCFFLAVVFQNFVEKSFVWKRTLLYGINWFYSYSLPGFSWNSGLQFTKPELGYIQDKKLLLLIENNIRGGMSDVMGVRHVVSGPNRK